MEIHSSATAGPPLKKGWVWGHIPTDELFRYLLMTAASFSTMVGYWTIRPMKEAIFISVVGLKYEPSAKIGTMFFMVPVLFAYQQLVSKLHLPHLIASVVATVYGTVFAFIALGLSVDGVGNPAVAGPENWFGWAVYWCIESYGSVVVPLLWTAIASVNRANQKTDIVRVLRNLNISMQVGAIAGSLVAVETKKMSFSTLFYIQAASVLFNAVLIYFALVGHQEAPVKEEKALNNRGATGLFEGLRLIATDRYVMAITVVSTFAEVIFTIMDFQMKVLASEQFATKEDFKAFMGTFGIASNSVSLVFAVLGTKFFLEKLGLMPCLVGIPSIIAGLVLAVYIYPSVWMSFGGIVAVKALGYSLNKPCIEVAYTHTSSDVRFKAKSWIEMFGTRGAKAIGSVVNNTFRGSIEILLTQGSAISFGFTLVWLGAAQRLGSLYERTTQVKSVKESEKTS
eukprot:CFRG5814T1